MEFSKRIKIVSDTAAVALGAGAAAASNGSEPEDIKLDDTATIQEVDQQLDFDDAASLQVEDSAASNDVVLAEDSVASEESTDSGDSVESGDSTDSSDSTD